jgi:hypothetical protein
MVARESGSLIIRIDEPDPENLRNERLSGGYTPGSRSGVEQN